MYAIVRSRMSLAGRQSCRSESTLSISWGHLLGTRVHKPAQFGGAEVAQQQTIAISVTKCIAAAYQQDTGTAVELASRCIIEEVHWTHDRVADITACFQHAVKPGIPLAANWPNRYKKPSYYTNAYFSALTLTLLALLWRVAMLSANLHCHLNHNFFSYLIALPSLNCKTLWLTCIYYSGQIIITHQTGEGNRCHKHGCSKNREEIKSMCLDCGYGKKWKCVVLSGSGPEVWQINTIEGEYRMIHKKNGCSQDPNQLYGPLGINQVAWYPVPPKRWNK